MRCDARRALALGCVCALALGFCAVARGETPTLLAGSVLYESPTLVSPALLARITLDSDDEWRFAQVGWTSAAEYLHPLRPHLAFVAGVSLTPLFAHASNRIYHDGRRDYDAEFGDTSAQASAGVRLRHGDFTWSEWRALVLKEWLFDFDDSVQAAFWRDPYAGLQTSFGFADLRSDEPFKNRVDGVRAVFEVQALAGADGWARGRISLRAGRKIERVFLRLNMLAFAISTDNLVARELVGGAWDVLEGVALYGHPYAELRARRGLAANAGIDVELWRGIELGARAAAFGDHARAQVGAHGEALLAMAQIAGALLTCGVATPDGDAFRGRWDTLRVFAAASAATLVP